MKTTTTTSSSSYGILQPTMLLSLLSAVLSIGTAAATSQSACLGVCPDGGALSSMLDITGLSMTCGELDTMAKTGQIQCSEAQLLASFCECANTRCPLCPNGQAITKPFTLLPNSVLTCADYEMSIGFANETDCTIAKPQEIVDFCGCNDSTNNDNGSNGGGSGSFQNCTFCEDGSAPGNFDLQLPDTNLTCGSFAALATLLNETACADLHSNVLPTFCGCPTAPTTGCTLCPEGDPVGNPNLVVSIPGGTTQSCAAFDAFLNVGADQEVCDSLQLFLSGPCGCPNPLVPTCTLCEDGSSSPTPDLLIDGENTCLAIEQGAGVFSESICTNLQGTAGVYCGCDNPTTAAQVCRVCGDNILLPNPSLVAGTEEDGDPLTCAIIEFEAGTDSSACAASRAQHAATCCAGLSSGTPAPTPTGSTATTHTNPREMVMLGLASLTASVLLPMMLVFL